MQIVLWFVLMLVSVSWVFLLVKYRAELKAIFCEKVLSRPVIIFESDDWGAGDFGQDASLRRIKLILENCRLQGGYHPVFVLGVNLFSPCVSGDSLAMPRKIKFVGLADVESSNTLAALLEVHHSGLMPLELHGKYHFDPSEAEEYLLDSNVGVEPDAAIMTEELPPSIQTRWKSEGLESKLDASSEVSVFFDVLGVEPQVVIPPTFVWNDSVEDGWKEAGMLTLMTPGSRYYSRIGNDFFCDKEHIYNGLYSHSGLMCLVRNAYFEPYKGVSVSACLLQIKQAVECGRPVIIETHRWNYLNPDKEICENSFSLLEQLLGKVSTLYPDLVSLSSAHLSKLYRSNGLIFNASFLVKLDSFYNRLGCSTVNNWLLWFSGVLPSLLFLRHLIRISKNAGLSDPKYV
ncbi:hypothetical protein MIB92_14550 [Aestuariirhabdus sp. Z084]|uniref:hypothetical protein n=1 Tax=Aestuariirhabdus haliotis TaxID=2918751 RepID=UPI00201B451F|nr:hypothetical protein [Aestuariirhabdus haliotis]MCL6416878.1 hypothetical protein [Aestuariirhabdus haliotis]MCL6420903.1 hypothetical protein [Aestuariirhabdus haliotis]